MLEAPLGSAIVFVDELELLVAAPLGSVKLPPVPPLLVPLLWPELPELLEPLLLSGCATNAPVSIVRHVIMSAYFFIDNVVSFCFGEIVAH